MRNESLVGSFPLMTAVVFQNGCNAVYTVIIVKAVGNGDFAYLLRSEECKSYHLATHGELKPQNGIEVGDSVMWEGGSYTVIECSADRLFVSLKGIHLPVRVNNITMVKRASAQEFDNAVRKVYGPVSNMLETVDDIKMGYVDTKYGQIIYDEIIRARNENKKYKR
jgi:hypothetical protein